MGKFIEKLKMPKFKAPKFGFIEAMPKLNMGKVFDLKAPKMHNIRIPSITQAMHMDHKGTKFEKAPGIVKPPKIVHTERLSEMGKGIGALGRKKHY